jgi:hypothetical protein
MEGVRHAQQTLCFKSTLDETRSARQAAGHADFGPLQSGGQSKPCWLSGPATSTVQGSKGATAKTVEAMTSPSAREFVKEAG